MWMPSVSSEARIFSLRPGILYLALCLLIVSWILLAVGGYWSSRLYRQYVEVQRENRSLLQKEKELEALQKTMEGIKKHEKIIRGFLGLDEKKTSDNGLGQGGEPSPDLSTVALNDTMTGAAITPAARPHSLSWVQRAQTLETNLKELVDIMRDRRQMWDSTPSIVPVEGGDYWFSSGFGWRRSPFTGLREFHNGLDISGRKGTHIIAPANGVVIKRGRDKYLGKYLKISHGRGIVTIYGHLADFKVKRGDKVTRGQVIAVMGNTGLSTGNHLHYMVKVHNRAINPIHYILNAKRNTLVGHP